MKNPHAALEAVDNVLIKLFQILFHDVLCVILHIREKEKKNFHRKNFHRNFHSE